MAYMNTGDPIQVALQRAERVGTKNQRVTWKKQKRRATEEAKRKRVTKLRPKKRGI